MVQKRPFDNEEVYKVSSKRPRQMERHNKLVSILEFIQSEVPPYQVDTVEKKDVHEKSISDFIPEISVSGKKDDSALGCPSMSSGVTCGNSEEDVRLEVPFQILLSPEYADLEHSVRTVVYPEDIYSLLMENPPHKLVAIGPNHQAVIPEWCPRDTLKPSGQIGASNSGNALPQLESVPIVGDDNQDKLIGTCVIPMPELQLHANDTEKFENACSKCCCQDEGSFRCVRQHITEAREKLKQIVGQEIFLELGFCDMGEAVALKWSEEEERLFHEVIYYHPPSLGKNFWDHLATVFSFRTKKDIVSYYFNVFLLQKRAEQNRWDPMNIDSDNDEWEGDESGDDGTGLHDEDDDSVVGSPVSNVHNYKRTHADNLLVKNQDVVDGICINVDSQNGQGTTSSTSTGYQLSSMTLWNETENHVAWDDSCASSDTISGSLESQKDDPWPGYGHGFNNTQRYVLEPCDKVWGAHYMTCNRNEFDFLSTHNMIEEVFGNGARNYNTTDSKGLK